VQLRVKKDVKETWDQEVYEIAKRIIGLKKRYPFTLIINDFVDVAAEIGADGVHVGAGDLPLAEVRRRLGINMIVGYSAHSVPEAVHAASSGADYVAFGAVFPTKTKGQGHPVQGLERLAAAVSKVPVPVVAIGGINRSNIDAVLKTGAASAAMITALTEAENISREVKWYVGKW
jgi:thiamine-phosphate pyrophosphorylase